MYMNALIQENILEPNNRYYTDSYTNIKCMYFKIIHFFNKKNKIRVVYYKSLNL